MKIYSTWLAGLLLLIGGCAAMAGQAEAEASEDSVESWLGRIEERSAEIETLRGLIRFERVQGLLGDEQTRFGHLVYDAGPPARFAVYFDRMAVHGGPLQEQQRDFIFDGRWLAERQVDGQDRVFIRREMVPEGEVGQDMLRLGEGPFALPLDLERDTVLERFHVELVESEAEELADAVQLRLRPQEHVEIDQDRIDLWYDRESLLPLQARTINEHERVESTVRLGELELNEPVEEDEPFDTSPPEEAGWQVEVVALEDRR